MALILTDDDLSLTAPARAKLAELCAQADDSIAGVRVYATGGCNGIGFGMTFTDAIYEEDAVRELAGFKIVVDDGSLAHLRGVEIDFVDDGAGDATFVFNNLPLAPSGGCGSCGSGGGCS